MFKTLDDYILDTQRKEARFLSEWNKPTWQTTQEAWKAYEVSRNAQASVSNVLVPTYTYVCKDGTSIPCHNKGTHDFYKNNNY